MTFSEIENFSDSRVDILFKSYCSSFPDAERRNRDQFMRLFKHDNVKIHAINNGNDFIGYLIIWQFPDFVFLEHFEVFEKFRNRNFGAEILKTLTFTYPKIILESEPRVLNEMAKRRLDFYGRNGFQIISETYTQPSYGERKPALHLFLLANFKVNDLDKKVEIIYKKVYS